MSPHTVRARTVDKTHHAITADIEEKRTYFAHLLEVNPNTVFEHHSRLSHLKEVYIISVHQNEAQQLTGERTVSAI